MPLVCAMPRTYSPVLRDTLSLPLHVGVLPAAVGVGLGAVLGILVDELTDCSRPDVLNHLSVDLVSGPVLHTDHDRLADPAATLDFLPLVGVLILSPGLQSRSRRSPPGQRTSLTLPW